MYPTCSLNCNQCNSSTSTTCQACAGQYRDISGNCQMCNPICSECINSSDNCTACWYLNQIPPSCQCIDPQQYIDSNNVCQNCSYKCGSCINDSLSCTSCSEIERVLPNCDCSQDYEEKNQKCVKRVICNSNCESCFSNSSNCISCSQNRINPPLCECGEGFESQLDGSCIACQQSTYYDQSTQKCLQCNIGCKSCTSSTTCLECVNNTLYVNGNECLCSDEYQQLIKEESSGDIVCINKMGVSVQLDFQSTNYFLIFTFDHQLQDIDFKKNLLKSILSIYLSEVTKEYYECTDPQIIKNQLQVKISIKKTIKASQLFVTFLNTSIFVSSSGDYVLNNKYQNSPIALDIGPFLFQDGLVDTHTQDQLNQQISQLRDYNQDIFTIFTQFQFIFYILNTLQPSIMFFLINARFPPNLYKFYQLIAQMTFPQVSDYLSNSYKTSFSMLGFEINQNEISYPLFGRYKYLGMCTSLLINNVIMVIKYAILVLILTSSYLINLIKIPEDKNGCFKQNQSNSQKILTFVIQKLNSENEINLMIVCISVFVEMSNINQEYYFSRIGLYLSLLLLVLHIGLFKFNYCNICSADPVKRSYSEIFLDRIQDECDQNSSNKWMKYYFLIQLLKKYLIIFIIYFLYSYPIYTCSICGFIFACSMVLSITLKPYKTIFNRWIKVIGELLMSVLWLLHIAIVLLEQEVDQTGQEEDQSKRSVYYVQIANAIVILLIIFNLLYLINKFYDVILLVKSLFQQSNLKDRQVRNKGDNKNIICLSKQRNKRVKSQN